MSFGSTGGTYIIQGTPPIKTLTSLGFPVFRLRPLMVTDEPPALGPLSGKILLSTGFCSREDRQNIEKGSYRKVQRD